MENGGREKGMERIRVQRIDLMLYIISGFTKFRKPMDTLLLQAQHGVCSSPGISLLISEPQWCLPVVVHFHTPAGVNQY